MGNNKIKIKIGNIEFEVEGDSTEFLTKEREKFLEVIPNIMINFPIVTYNKLEEDLKEINNDINVENKLLLAKNEKKQNLSSFLREKEFCTEVELVLGVIYFCQQIEGREYISSNDVKEKLKISKQKIPTNISHNFSRLANKGYIQQTETKENNCISYYITEDGIKFIDEYVKKEVTKKTIKSKRKKTYSNLRYDIKTREEINASKYPSFNNLTTKEKIMLLMYILLKEKNIIYTEIEELTEIMNNVFNTPISHDACKDTFRNNKKYFHKKDSENNKRAKEFKLIEEGIAFVDEKILNNRKNQNEQ